MHAARDDIDGDRHEQRVHAQHQRIVGEQCRQMVLDLFQRLALECPAQHRTILYAADHIACKQANIIEHPARNHAVEGQDQERAEHADTGQCGPCGGRAAVARDHLGALDRIALAMPPDQRFRQQHRQADQHHTDDVENNEGTAAILTGLRGKAPEIAQPHGRSGRRQNEAPSRRPAFGCGCAGCCHLWTLSFIRISRRLYAADRKRQTDWRRRRPELSHA